MKLDHIGVVFKSLSRGRSYFKKYGFKPLTSPKMKKRMELKCNS